MTALRKVKSPYSNTLLEARKNPAGYCWQTYDINPASGVLPADVIKPEFWRQVSTGLRVGDELKVICDDNSYYMRLLVREVSPGVGATVAVLETFPKNLMDEIKVETGPLHQKSDEYAVKWKGPTHKHCVVRLSDDAVISKEHDTKEGAAAALAEYVANLTA